MKNDIVTQLISGKLNAEGKYIPFKENKNISLSEVIRNSNKSTHEIMVRENLRLPHLALNKKVFIKSIEEKATLSKVKKQHKLLLTKKGLNPNKRLNLSNPVNAVITT